MLKLSATFLSTWIIDVYAAISRQCTTNSDLSKLYDTSSYKPSKSRESPDDHCRLKFFLHLSIQPRSILPQTVTSNFLQVSTSQRTSWITTRTPAKKWHDVTYIQKLLMRMIQKTKPFERKGKKRTSNDDNFRILKHWTLRHACIYHIRHTCICTISRSIYLNQNYLKYDAHAYIFVYEDVVHRFETKYIVKMHFLTQCIFEKWMT